MMVLQMLRGVCPKPSLASSLAPLLTRNSIDVVQSLIGGRVQRGPAVLPGGIHVGAVIHQETHGLDRHRALFGRSRPDHVGAGAGRQHQRRRVLLGGNERIGPAFHQRLDGVEIVDVRRQRERRGALQETPFGVTVGFF